ncbi:MAG TPA: Fe2+-dependent dioxygenase [Gammaproteobacteria bacterium]|nr:Fe2+-dependent dioxygenase [Gammaproteobacteria bacterium]
MLITIDSIIDSQQLAVIRQALVGAPFVDGRLSAGKAAAQVKQNKEVNPQEQIATDLAKIIMGNLYHNEAFKLAALPYRVSTPIVARYTPGMHYGEHIDDPVMGTEGQRFRCDVATTVFLNEPDEYDGGVLVVRTTFGEKRVKLAAGSAVVYPASSLHQVTDVTRGTRLVAVTWIQSMVRDPAKREVLYELGLARETLLESSAGSETCQQLDHSYTNLVRMWADV